jgi:hypothetical protein
MKRRRVTIAAFCSLVLAVSWMEPAVASAPTPTTVQEMHFAKVASVSVMADLAYVTLAHGPTLRVPARYASNIIAHQKLARPSSDVVEGDCGSSYVFLNERTGTSPYALTTGFNVVLPAFYFTWDVLINGPKSYVHRYEPYGNISADYWNGAYLANGSRGRWTANVSSVDSVAILDDGSVCWSGGPYELAYL